jgi:hypothetical protein
LYHKTRTKAREIAEKVAQNCGLPFVQPAQRFGKNIFFKFVQLFY